MFADDSVICSERKEQVEERLERWNCAMESRGMETSRSETESVSEWQKDRWNSEAA